MRFQTRDYWCGPAALQNALQVLRKPSSQVTIADLAGTTQAEGTDEEGLKRAILALGYTFDEMAHRNPLTAWGLLGHSLFLGGRPVLLCVDRWTHWVTAVGICGSRVLVFDPANLPWVRRENGLLVVHRDRFLRRWCAGRRTARKLEPYYGLGVSELL